MGWIKPLALLVLAVSFCYRMLLTYFAYRSRNNPIPENVQDVYDADSYRTWQAYHLEKVRLGVWEETVSFLVTFLLFLLNAYALFAGFFGSSTWLQLFAVVLLSAISDLAVLPFRYYDDMVLEAKYGFSTMTKKTFFVDLLKETVLGLVLEMALVLLVWGVYALLGAWAVVAFTLVMALVSLVISLFSVKFMKLFNRFTPLTEGELYEKLTGMLQQNGFTVKEIVVMDASTRSTKANAAFAGFGKQKTVILFDTLVDTMTTDEICAVFAHEMGHGLHKDTLKLQWMSLLQLLIMGVCILLNIHFTEVCMAFGFSGVNYAFALLLALTVEMSLLEPILSFLSASVSRKAEYRADAEAVRQGYGEALISALKKLSRGNFANLAPAPVTVALTYSHPTVSQRIEAMERHLDARGE